MTKILLVDDEPLLLESLEIILSMSGDYEIIGKAGNGVEALAILSHPGSHARRSEHARHGWYRTDPEGPLGISSDQDHRADHILRRKEHLPCHRRRCLRLSSQRLGKRCDPECRFPGTSGKKRP